MRLSELPQPRMEREESDGTGFRASAVAAGTPSAVSAAGCRVWRQLFVKILVTCESVIELEETHTCHHVSL